MRRLYNGVKVCRLYYDDTYASLVQENKKLTGHDDLRSCDCAFNVCRERSREEAAYSVPTNCFFFKFICIRLGFCTLCGADKCHFMLHFY